MVHDHVQPTGDFDEDSTPEYTVNENRPPSIGPLFFPFVLPRSLGTLWGSRGPGVSFDFRCTGVPPHSEPDSLVQQ